MLAIRGGFLIITNYELRLRSNRVAHFAHKTLAVKHIHFSLFTFHFLAYLCPQYPPRNAAPMHDMRNS